MCTDKPTAAEAAPGYGPHIPHGARIWNYRVGGTDNFPADREVAEAEATSSSMTACTGTRTRPRTPSPRADMNTPSATTRK
ncbi:SAM-dependent methyltransferase [Pseudofrankia sp. BMG5.37]|nr:SAM-dependent methyltransferase [Pseudofrankia sp. BMG5.37]